MLRAHRSQLVLRAIIVERFERSAIGTHALRGIVGRVLHSAIRGVLAASEQWSKKWDAGKGYGDARLQAGEDVGLRDGVGDIGEVHGR